MGYPKMTDISQDVLDLIDIETHNAKVKHGSSLETRDSEDRRSNILSEESGEVAEAAMNYADCLEGPINNCMSEKDHLKHELTQVASVAVRWLEVLG